LCRDIKRAVEVAKGGEWHTVEMMVGERNYDGDADIPF